MSKYVSKIKKQMAKLQLFPDKLFFLEALKLIIIEIKKTEDVVNIKKTRMRKY
jgi:hypothetical protein